MEPCNLCESLRIKKITTQKGWGIYRCHRCGFGYARPLDDRAETPNYNQEYFDPFVSRDSREGTIHYFALKKMSSLSPGKKILDVGCGTSSFPIIANGLDWKAWAVDGSEAALKRYQSNGVPFIKVDFDVRGGLSQALITEAPFDAINCYHVIEHLRNPKDVLRQFNALLKQGGVLRLGFPFYSQLQIKAQNLAYFIGLANHPYQYWVPDHISYFDKKRIFPLLNQLGFEILESRHDGFLSLADFIRRSNHSSGFRETVFKLSESQKLLEKIGCFRYIDLIARKHGSTG